jgi:tRNA(Arg) A34 adenosine deaminase TadA
MAEVITSTPSSSPAALVAALFSTVTNAIIPLTQKGVSSGSKLFGAAILSRHDLTPLTCATNNERVSPLLHGEINCIQHPDTATRPSPSKDCIFFATHEPCSLCLSGITWSGFNELYYLLTYEDSRDLFSIPYDIDILESVFRVQGEETDEQLSRRALYNRKNKFFRARSVEELIEEVQDQEQQARMREEMARVKGLYSGLSIKRGRKRGWKVQVHGNSS